MVEAIMPLNEVREAVWAAKPRMTMLVCGGRLLSWRQAVDLPSIKTGDASSVMNGVCEAALLAFSTPAALGIHAFTIDSSDDCS